MVRLSSCLYCNGPYEKEVLMADTMMVSMDQYNELVADQKWLRALEAAGVDNWDGYDYALELYNP